MGAGIPPPGMDWVGDGGLLFGSARGWPCKDLGHSKEVAGWLEVVCRGIDTSTTRTDLASTECPQKGAAVPSCWADGDARGSADGGGAR